MTPIQAVILLASLASLAAAAAAQNVPLASVASPAKATEGVAPPVAASTDKALRQAERRAERGSVEDQLWLAGAYYLGRDAKQDYALAARWFEAAAKQGRPEAQHNLAAMYQLGRGVAQDHTAAAQWHMRAVAQGYAPSQLALGLIYLAGEGVPVDAMEAARLLQIAAAKGNARAQYEIGALYAVGDGVPASSGEAYFWLDLAVDRLPVTPIISAVGLPPRASRSQALALRNTAGAKLTSEQLAEVRLLSSEWKAASKKDRKLQLALADRYLTGRGAPQSNIEAYRWLSLAIRGGAVPWEVGLPGAITTADRNAALDRLTALRTRMTEAEIVAAEQLADGGMPIR